MKLPVEKLDHGLPWQSLPDLARWTVEQAVAIQQIPAPTFQEQQRAAYVAEQFKALGLQEVQTDDVYNVYGRLPGAKLGKPGVMISAHTDTIFSPDTDLTIRRENGLIYGPGVGDNSAGVAGLLGLAYYLHKHAITPRCDLWFVATTREEGLGDLGGMRAAFQHVRDRVSCVINLEGLAFGHVYHAGISVRRLHITATVPGGHSWLHFGRPSAVHTIVTLGAKIATFQPPTSPRTTFNIGMIEGGEAINAIATNAGLWLDMRSENRETLAALEAQVMSVIRSLETAEVSFKIEVVGDRPAGVIPANHPLVEGAVAALERIGVRGVLETGSTDANVPLSLGVPAVTIGLTRGGNAHRLDEYMETEPVEPGLRQLIVLTLAAAEAEGR
jgi:tripeptide aminopeptidase